MRLSLRPDVEIRLDPNELEVLRQVEISQPSYTVQAGMETAMEGTPPGMDKTRA